ncbi:L-idonate 5-dehydrogenase [Microlunatus sp. Gsoil 973]|jgi:L-idonate 5-dehydrogenase|uniref:L-idonate 5-dehydrogenase n=1 Tax=Microlunatus sp. Gsoil 973 TaxID=2672569 RepID=UPI0012B4C8DF|nr:L-idonate 5-dehydrogenase [Microlunatus sp. Gsoil 973]QGN31870.1 alcohol dehydrogenase catalytic domain-containing protein [Microlunatus sp. Gsoil 973]
MLACVIESAGKLAVVPKPDPEPGPGEVAVDIVYGGICGSDLHYYHDGAAGEFVIREPLVVGHEVVGRVGVIGEGVTGIEVGTPVAVHPAQVCGECEDCTAGRPQLCASSRYLGSAAHFPHIQGGFTQRLVVGAGRAVPLPDGMSLRRAALSEPFSVAYHAVRRAGELTGRSVLVTGAGPIGCLAVAAAREAGAETIYASDLTDYALAQAKQMGADVLLRADHPDDPAWPAKVDVAIEASGSGPGLNTCIRTVRRAGTVVQVGILPPGMTSVLGNALVNKEIELLGSWRFHDEFADAIGMLADRIDAEPLISHEFPLADARAAFDTASDRTTACKVLLQIADPEAVVTG